MTAPKDVATPLSFTDIFLRGMRKKEKSAALRLWVNARLNAPIDHAMYMVFESEDSAREFFENLKENK